MGHDNYIGDLKDESLPHTLPHAVKNS